MRKAPSPAQPKSTPANSSKRTAARCSSMKSANCRRRRRSSCCAQFRKARSSRSAGARPVKVDVRIISATNRNLIADVKAGRFREDLFYRLHVFPISVPPLRSAPRGYPGPRPPFPHALRRRRRQARARHQRARRWRCSPPISWPGNVRQLENAIFRAIVLADGEEIGVDEFPQIAAQVSSDGLRPAVDRALACHGRRRGRRPDRSGGVRRADVPRTRCR